MQNMTSQIWTNITESYINSSTPSAVLATIDNSSIRSSSSGSILLSDNGADNGSVQSAVVTVITPTESAISLPALIISTLIKVITLVFGSIGNVAVFCIILKSSYLQTWENGFHVGLAAMDLLVCVLFIPAMIAGDLLAIPKLQLAVCYCSAFPVIGNMLCMASIARLRYKKYKSPSAPSVSKSHVIRAMAAIVVWSFLVTLAPIFAGNFSWQSNWCANTNDLGPLPAIHARKVMFVGTMVLCIGIYIFCYTRLMVRFSQSIREVRAKVHPARVQYIARRNSNALHVDDINLGIGPSVSKAMDREVYKSYKRLIEQDKRVVVSSILVVVVFFLSMTPLLIIMMFGSYMGRRLLVDMENIAAAVTSINSLLNPYIYTLRSQHFRKAVHHIVPCVFPSTRSRVSPAVVGGEGKA